MGGTEMSYHFLGGFTKEQEEALYDVKPERIRSMNAERRIEMMLQHGEQEVAKRDAFWNAVQAFATGAIPILAFMGIAQWGKK